MFLKCHTPWNKGLQNIYSDETKVRMANIHLGKSSWNKLVLRYWERDINSNPEVVVEEIEVVLNDKNKGS